MWKRTSLAGVAALFVLMCSACGSSPVTRFYVLESTVAAPGDAYGAAVGLGPVELPPYVDRDAIVTRSGANTLTLAEFDRWAEPLQDGVERVLLRDLTVALGTSSVEPHPWGGTHIDVRVPVQVLRFDVDGAGAAVLVARWSVLREDHTTLAEARTSEISVPAEGAGFEGTVGALSRSLGRLAAEIAAEIRRHPAAP